MRRADLTQTSRCVELVLPWFDTVTDCFPAEMQKMEERLNRQIRKERRQELRAAKRDNPSFMRKLRKMDEIQLRTLYAESLEAEMRAIEGLPDYRTNAELQRLWANHEYLLRSTRALINYAVNPPKPRPVPRYRPQPKVEPILEAVPVALPTTLSAAVNPFPDAPKPEPEKKPEVDDDRCYPKFFHNSSGNDVW